MYKKITIDGKELEFAANAATPFRYKQVFKSDLFYVLSDEKRAEEQGAEAIMRLAYIMNKQAEKADMNKLNEEDFISWLEGYSALAFINAADQIMTVYTDSAVGTATP